MDAVLQPFNSRLIFRFIRRYRKHPFERFNNNLGKMHGTVSVALRVCVNVGPGSPAALNASTRYMTSGSNSLTYGLFSDAGATTTVGSNFWRAGGGNPIIIAFPLFIGTVTRTATLYGQIYYGQ
ncbi:spore coat protein U domain-containing protein [Methylocystis sp. Sn-Cys]|nr:spore coat protein U domain-containing protein [Methylocystis sp. Sn-Cys]